MFVYLLTNTVNGKRYVGKACLPTKRWTQHKVDAKRGSDTPLCRSLRKHGAAAFRFEVVQECASEAESYDAEREWITKLDSTILGNGYNQTGGGEGLSQCLPETRRRMSAARAGKPRPPSEIAARAAANRENGKKATTLALAAELFTAGLSLNDIGRRIGRTGVRVGQLLSEAGIRETLKRDPGRAAARKARIVELRRRGLTMDAIAVKVGASIGWVHRVCAGASGKTSARSA